MPVARDRGDDAAGGVHEADDVIERVGDVEAGAVRADRHALSFFKGFPQEQALGPAPSHQASRHVNN